MTTSPFNPKDHIHHLQNLDLNDDEKSEVINGLWHIAKCFVDDAFNPNKTDHQSSADPSNVIDLESERRARAKPANDNAALRPKKGAA